MLKVVYVYGSMSMCVYLYLSIYKYCLNYSECLWAQLCIDMHNIKKVNRPPVVAKGTTTLHDDSNCQTPFTFFLPSPDIFRVVIFNTGPRLAASPHGHGCSLVSLSLYCASDPPPHPPHLLRRNEFTLSPGDLRGPCGVVGSPAGLMGKRAKTPSCGEEGD